MQHWPISHLTMSRMCPPCMQISFQGPFRAARSREGEAGQVCVEPHPIVEWMTMVFFFFCHEYFRIQPVLQLPSLPPCQLTLFRSVKPDIFPLLSNVENTHSSKHIIFMKKAFALTSFLKDQFKLIVLPDGLNIFGSMNDRFASTNKGPTATAPGTWHAANE